MIGIVVFIIVLIHSTIGRRLQQHQQRQPIPNLLQSPRHHVKIRDVMIASGQQLAVPGRCLEFVEDNQMVPDTGSQGRREKRISTFTVRMALATSPVPTSASKFDNSTMTTPANASKSSTSTGSIALDVDVQVRAVLDQFPEEPGSYQTSTTTTADQGEVMKSITFWIV